MPQTAESAATLQPSTFADMLAALAASASKPSPRWPDDDLAEDVVTLSYERALKAHAHHRPSAVSNRQEHITAPADRAEARKAIPLAPVARHDNRKCASVTIRLTQEECDQLRARAAEAGMTISAYLRSCTFEVEALRTQVKEALARLQPIEPQPDHSAPRPWWRLWTHEGRRTA